jgi:hypothetical protein
VKEILKDNIQNKEQKEYDDIKDVKLEERISYLTDILKDLLFDKTVRISYSIRKLFDMFVNSSVMHSIVKLTVLLIIAISSYDYLHLINKVKIVYVLNSLISIVNIFLDSDSLEQINNILYTFSKNDAILGLPYPDDRSTISKIGDIAGLVSTVTDIPSLPVPGNILDSTMGDNSLVEYTGGILSNAVLLVQVAPYISSSIPVLFVSSIKIVSFLVRRGYSGSRAVSFICMLFLQYVRVLFFS